LSPESAACLAREAKDGELGLTAGPGRLGSSTTLRRFVEDVVKVSCPRLVAALDNTMGKLNGSDRKCGERGKRGELQEKKIGMMGSGKAAGQGRASPLALLVP
jgi:hypothetical protein